MLAAATAAGTMSVVGGGAAGADDIGGGGAADPIFVDVSDAAFNLARRSAQFSDDVTLTARPVRSRSTVLNRAEAEAALSVAASEANPIVIALPAPDGSNQSFAVWPNDVLAPGLAAKFPEIKTFSGRGITDTAATIALDLTPLGFHAQVLTPEGTWYIDPAIHLADELHVTYLKLANLAPPQPFVERMFPGLDDVAESQDHSEFGSPAEGRAGAQLRTHRLAFSVDSTFTGFYTSVPLAQAGLATITNRVSAIYQQEVAVKFQLVANNNLLAFTGTGGACASAAVGIQAITDPGFGPISVQATGHGRATGDIVQIAGTASGVFNGKWAITVVDANNFTLDGRIAAQANVGAGGTVSLWTWNGNPNCDPFNNLSRDLDVNQVIVDGVVGNANYDVGHHGNTSGGGLAGLGVVGVTGQKARGMTGSGSPTGDSYSVDFVAHELGHQYGGNHSYNGNTGNCSTRSTPNAYEPGSGSTIQAYAGICGLDNLQTAGNATGATGASDPYFHSTSFDEIITHLATPAGSAAGTTAPSGNAVPTINAGAPVTIPAQTPFFLNAAGTDANAGNTLLYNFEQRDLGAQRALNMPQITAGPLFRSFPANASTRSDFPRLSELRTSSTNVTGACPALSGAIGPALCWSQYTIPVGALGPVGSTRTLNFRGTVRDGAGVGTSAGGVNTADTTVTVSDTGTQFAVTAPVGGTFPANAVPVTWNVAGTTAAPINAGTVSIRVSTDSGATFPFSAVMNTPNDGMETISVPNAVSGTLRVMVHSGNYTSGGGFFNVTTADFSSTVARPTVTINQAAGQTDPTSSTTINFTAMFNDNVTGFDATDVTVGGTSGATNVVVTPVNGSMSTYNVAVTGVNTPGTVTVTVKDSAATGSGLASTASTSTDNSVTYALAVNPTVTINQAAGQADPTSTTPIKFTVVFSAAVTGFAASDVTLASTAGPATATVTGTGTTYEVSVSGPNAAGTVTATIPAGAAVNATSAPSLASTSTDNVVTFAPSASTAEIISITPGRVLETRPGERTIDGVSQTGTRLAARQFLQVPMFNRAGVSGDAAAVVLNVTAINPSGTGFLTIYPCGTRPLASSLNYRAGDIVGNEVVAKLDATGNVCVYTEAETHLTADVVGYVPKGSPIVSLTPARVLETRPGETTIDGFAQPGARIGAFTEVQFSMGGRAGVAANAAAVILNVTAVNPSGVGFLTVYPCGALPLASSLNYGPGDVAGNEVVAKLSATGTLCIYTEAETHLTADVVGYVPNGAKTTSLTPARVFESRAGEATVDGQRQGEGRVAAGGQINVQIAGRANVPATGAGSVIMNVTAINPSGVGFFTIHPCGTRPLASSLNFKAGDVVGNEVIAKLSATGSVCVYTEANTHISIDVVGYVPA